MSSQRDFFAEVSDTGKRLDKWLMEQFSELELDCTRSALQKWIEKGFVLVNGATVSKSYALRAGDMIHIYVPEPVECTMQPENIPLDIVYQDRDLLVVNKPKNMVVHPAPGNYSGTLVNALLYHCKGELSGINGVIRPGIIHRIDKNTSGLLLVAKNDAAHVFLAEQIKSHSFMREYASIVCGSLKETAGTVDAPIGRHPVDRKKMSVTPKNSKPAITHYRVLQASGQYSYLSLRLETGRTHQIRVHMAYLGHPVLGDDVYGKPYKDLNGQCLHAKKIGFIHPTTRHYMEFDSELPEYFQKILQKLKFE